MAALVSCGSNARIDGTLTDAASSEVIVKLLESNRYEVLDTVKTDASGHFSYKVDVAEGQPEFVYIFYKDKKIASLLLEAGDKVEVEVNFSKVDLIDHPEDGTLEGEVYFLLYKGDHYHLTVRTAHREYIWVDTNDIWDKGDLVGINIAPKDIKISKRND